MYSPEELANVMLDVSYNKVNRNALKVFVSAMLAGMFIGLGYYANIVINSYEMPIIGSNTVGILRFLGAFIFAVGLIMVIVAGADLFTGNCLVMFGVYNKRIKFVDAIVHLLLVLLGNLIGACFLALLIYYANSPSTTIINSIEEIAASKLDKSFISLVILGILCNILVAIAVYMAYAAKNITGKVIVVILPIIAFILMAFEHSVANMFIFPLNALLQKDSLFLMFNNLLPVILGNFIGGGIILPLSYTVIYLKK